MGVTMISLREREVELARQTLADLIGARAREILLLSGGTESIDLAIRGALDAQPASRALVTTRVEHAAVRDIAVAWEKGGTRPVRWAPLREHGLVDLAVLETLLDGAPGVGLVSIQWANNETGVVQGVGEIAEICRRRGVLFHCDATQWVGKERVPAPVGDLMTFAPHKFHGPKGVGALFVYSKGDADFARSRDFIERRFIAGIVYEPRSSTPRLYDPMRNFRRFQAQVAAKLPRGSTASQ